MPDSSIPPQQNPQQDLSSFADKLIDEKQFPDLTPEVRDEIKRDILTRINDFMASKIISSLSDADVLTFEQMLKDKKTEKEIQDFVSTHIPEFPTFLTNTLLEFRGIYLGIIPPPHPTDSNTSQPQTPQKTEGSN